MKTEKGITILALVVTIIILLILAGVTINMVLGDEGIIAQAQQAKQAQEEAEEKQNIELKKGEALSSQYGQTLTKEEINDQSNEEIQEATEGSIWQIKKIAKGGTGADKDEIISIPIPKGLAYLSGETVEEGIVVIDGYGNEFVWVPVDNINEFAVQKEGTTDYRGILYNFDTSAGTINQMENIENIEPGVLNSNKMDYSQDVKKLIKEERYDSLEEQYQTEFNEMVESVKTYGGFYVGRYETSWTGDKVTSLKEKKSMTGETDFNNIGWNIKDFEGNSLTKATWYGLYQKQKELYLRENENCGMVSGMIWGCQWDAIMKWMKDVKNPTVNNGLYIFNSRMMGWYLEVKQNAGILNNEGLTGLDRKGVYNKVKNIYDLAGNKSETTMEVVGLSHITRGGNSSNYGTAAFSPVSIRWTGNGIYSSLSYSSRLQLYVK